MHVSSLITSFFIPPADEVVSGGKVNAIVMMGTIPYQKSYDLCDLLKDIDVTCPVKSGKLSFGIKLKVPGFIPAVSELYLTQTVTNKTYSAINCFSFTQTKIASPPPP